MRAFYTYVWGGFGDEGGPLTFTSKASRTLAIRSSNVGDIVFGCVAQNPSVPGVQIHDDDRGRVVMAWQISHAEAAAADYGIAATQPWEADEHGNYRWPHALQPIRAWRIDSPPLFKELEAYDNETHTQRAISSIQEPTTTLQQELMGILKQKGVELDLLEPYYKTLSGRIKSLKQQHPFARNSYEVTPDTEAINNVYIAVLGDANLKVIKIGHAIDAEARIEEFNKYRLASEKQWRLYASQPMGKVEDAIAVERRLGEEYSNYRTESNNEIYVGVSAFDVMTRLATI